MVSVNLTVVSLELSVPRTQTVMPGQRKVFFCSHWTCSLATRNCMCFHKTAVHGQDDRFCYVVLHHMASARQHSRLLPPPPNIAKQFSSNQCRKYHYGPMGVVCYQHECEVLMLQVTGTTSWTGGVAATILGWGWPLLARTRQPGPCTRPGW